MKELVFISAQPSDLYFSWQVDVQLNNFQKFGYDKQAQVLIFMKKDEEIQNWWKELELKYFNTEFFYYWDTDRIEHNFIVNFKYVSLLRPYILKKHFLAKPELKDAAIFYHDSDIIFTKPLDFSSYLDDDVNYLSRTTYIDYDYFKSKIDKVVESKKGQYIKANPVKEFAHLLDLSEEDLERNNENTGGAQYLLKNIDAKFWADVFDGCLFIKIAMHNANQRYFQGNTAQERENNGFQAWCADMWSVLWNLWRRKQETRCPKEFDFTWATDEASKWGINAIYHDAGATTSNSSANEIFYKRQLLYVNNILTPLNDEDYLNKIGKDYCSYHYVQAIKDTIKT